VAVSVAEENGGDLVSLGPNSSKECPNDSINLLQKFILKVTEEAKMSFITIKDVSL
jgi:hypothetical protein